MLSDGVTAAMAGYLGLKVMDQATTRLYALASEADKAREKAVSPGVAYTVAAKDTAGVVGLSLTEEQALPSDPCTTIYWGSVGPRSMS